MIRRILLVLSVLCAAPAAHAQDANDGRIGTGLECVPFAREMSGLAIFGDAWTWWSQANGHYREGHDPKVGAVLAFRPHGPMRLGHVAVVSKIVSNTIIMVTHANWSRIGGVRGKIERDVTIVDVSAAHDWSEVRVWWDGSRGLGTTAYPIFGFIYGTPDTRTSPKLASPSPDIVGAVIDSLGA